MLWFSLSNFAALGLAYILWKALYQVVYYRYFHPLVYLPRPFLGQRHPAVVDVPQYQSP